MGNINIKGSKLGNGTVIIGGNIKNSSIEGNSVSIINNKIFVDGRKYFWKQRTIGDKKWIKQILVLKKRYLNLKQN